MLSQAQLRNIGVVMEPSGYVCAQCQNPVTTGRLQTMMANPGEWFACETAWCDWVQIRTLRGQFEFSSEANARTNDIPLCGAPRPA